MKYVFWTEVTFWAIENFCFKQIIGDSFVHICIHIWQVCSQFLMFLLNKGNSIFVVLLESILLFLGDLHCVRAMPVRNLQVLSVGASDNERYVRYRCSIFVQEWFDDFQYGVFVAR